MRVYTNDADRRHIAIGASVACLMVVVFAGALLGQGEPIRPGAEAPPAPAVVVTESPSDIAAAERAVDRVTTAAEREARRQDREKPARFRSCVAARAAGAAPLRRGDPGWSSRLDDDGDGIACAG